MWTSGFILASATAVGALSHGGTRSISTHEVFRVTKPDQTLWRITGAGLDK